VHLATVCRPPTKEKGTVRVSLTIFPYAKASECIEVFIRVTIGGEIETAIRPVSIFRPLVN
jgi:hypothetical protein